MSTGKQDMPPPGGYKQIQTSRVPLWGPKTTAILVGIAIWFPLGIWHHEYKKHRANRRRLEDDEGRIGLEPLLFAENERLLLWQMRRNRDEENELMKNVPGWVTGTFFGKPIYQTDRDMNTWVSPTYTDLYPHVRKRDRIKHFAQWHYTSGC